MILIPKLLSLDQCFLKNNLFKLKRSNYSGNLLSLLFAQLLYKIKIFVQLKPLVKKIKKNSNIQISK